MQFFAVIDTAEARLLLVQGPGLRPRSIAIVLLQLKEYRRRRVGNIEAFAAVATDKLVGAISQCYRHPLLVGLSHIGPYLNLYPVSRGPWSSSDVPNKILTRLRQGIAIDYLEVAAVGRLELPFLVRLCRAAGVLLHGGPIGIARAIGIDAKSTV